MKSVLFIIHSLSSGGAEKVLIDILDEFDYSNYSVKLLIIKREGRYIERVNPNVKILFLHSNTLMTRFLNRVMSNIKMYEVFTTFKLRKNVKDKFDTIISFSHGDSLKYHNKILCKSSKNITWVHCDMWNRAQNQKINVDQEKIYYNNMDKIIFVSNDAQKQFNNLYCFNIITSQQVIYNLIPVEKILRLADSEEILKNKFTICTVGRLYEEKAYDRLIRVSAMLKNAGYDFEVWIVAEGVLYEKLLQLTKYLKVSDRVIFFGFKNNPYPYIKNSDVFISTSKTEAMPLVVCEALCLGKPIVSTKTTGPIELLSGSFGVLTDHDDVSICNALISLIKSKELVAYYSARARERSKIFNKSLVMDSIYGVM